MSGRNTLRSSLLGSFTIHTECFTDFPAYSDTVYSDNPLTVTLLARPKRLICYSTTSGYSDNLVTVTLFPCPEGVTVSGDLCTDLFGYSDTGYSDTPPTVTVSVNPKLPKSVTVNKYLRTATLFPCPNGVTVTEDVFTSS